MRGISRLWLVRFLYLINRGSRPLKVRNHILRVLFPHMIFRRCPFLHPLSLHHWLSRVQWTLDLWWRMITFRFLLLLDLFLNVIDQCLWQKLLWLSLLGLANWRGISTYSSGWWKRALLSCCYYRSDFQLRIASSECEIWWMMRHSLSRWVELSWVHLGCVTSLNRNTMTLIMIASLNSFNLLGHNVILGNITVKFMRLVLFLWFWCNFLDSSRRSNTCCLA